MYAWIEKNGIVYVDNVVAVLDVGVLEGKGTGDLELLSVEGEGSQDAAGARTVILMKDGRILLVAARKKAVVRWLSKGKLEGAGVKKIG
jgi:hypothetical protein